MEVVESRYGKLIASRKDKYLGKGLFKYGEFSEGEVDLFRKIIRKNHIVCDVGANIGAHTLVFSQLAAHVFSFEPLPTIFNCLAGMVALNDLRNVTLHQCGLSDRSYAMAYMDLDFDRDDNSFGSHTLEEFKGERAVPVYPLETPCHFLKIDVEGMESKVVMGAADMIKDCKPVMYVESDRVDEYEELYATVKDLGYYMYWHTPPLYNPNNFYGDQENVFGEIVSFNMICLPHPMDNCEEVNPSKDKHPKVSGYAAIHIS